TYTFASVPEPRAILSFPTRRSSDLGIERYESAIRAKESIKRDLTLRNEKLTQVNHTLNQVKVMSERDEKALNSIRQRETDIKERHQELKQLNKQIEDTERDNTLLRQDIS